MLLAEMDPFLLCSHKADPNIAQFNIISNDD